MHIGAACGKSVDGRRADPARAAGDERDPAVEPVVVRHSQDSLDAASLEFGVELLAVITTSNPSFSLLRHAHHRLLPRHG